MKCSGAAQFARRGESVPGNSASILTSNPQITLMAAKSSMFPTECLGEIQWQQATKGPEKVRLVRRARIDGQTIHWRH